MPPPSRKHRGVFSVLFFSFFFLKGWRGGIPFPYLISDTKPSKNNADKGVSVVVKTC